MLYASVIFLYLGSKGRSTHDYPHIDDMVYLHCSDLFLLSIFNYNTSSIYSKELEPIWLPLTTLLWNLFCTHLYHIPDVDLSLLVAVFYQRLRWTVPWADKSKTAIIRFTISSMSWLSRSVNKMCYSTVVPCTIELSLCLVPSMKDCSAVYDIKKWYEITWCYRSSYLIWGKRSTGSIDSF